VIFFYSYFSHPIKGDSLEKILITGAAGFIGFHTSKYLLEKGYEVVGLDNLNDYYPVSLKIDRLKQCGIELTANDHGFVKSSVYPHYKFIKQDVEDRNKVAGLFQTEMFDKVIHLAAQAGVRLSIDKPYKYIDSNINGFITILEGCRNTNVKHLIYASSSSVYGNSKEETFNEQDNVDHPVSLYAATKKANELMAFTYSHLYNIAVTGLRFFTVYGSWGRPDMAYFKFTKAMLENKPIDVYNKGELMRDFTFIDDIVEGMEKLLDKIPQNTPAYSIYNIGNSNPVKLLDFIQTIEEITGKVAVRKYKPMQDGDVYKTFADTSSLEKLTGFKPRTHLKDGLKEFVDWYKDYYGFN
jgi:UDP-glucuronate 4-epimerase